MERYAFLFFLLEVSYLLNIGTFEVNQQSSFTSEQLKVPKYSFIPTEVFMFPIFQYIQHCKIKEREKISSENMVCSYDIINKPYQDQNVTECG